MKIRVGDKVRVVGYEGMDRRSYFDGRIGTVYVIEDETSAELIELCEADINAPIKLGVRFDDFSTEFLHLLNDRLQYGCGDGWWFNSNRRWNKNCLTVLEKEVLFEL